MNTCKDCRYWGVAYEGVCDAPGCTVFKTIVRGFPPVTKFATRQTDGFAIDATADDDSGLEVNFVTGPDFGCVKFSPKA